MSMRDLAAVPQTPVQLAAAADRSQPEATGPGITVFAELALPPAPTNLAPTELWGWYQQQRNVAAGHLVQLLQSDLQSGKIKNFELVDQAFGALLETDPANLDALISNRAIGEIRIMRPGDVRPGQPGADWSPPLFERANAVRRLAESHSAPRLPAAPSFSLYPTTSAEASLAHDPKVGCSQPALPALTNGHFTVQMFDDQIDGLTINPNAPFTLTVDQGGGPVVNLQSTSDLCNRYSLHVGNPQQLKIFMPGSLVVVQEAGQADVSFLIPELLVDVNTQTNLISGNAPVSQTVQIFWSEGLLQVVQNVQTGSDGAFSFDFSGLTDITHAGTGLLLYTDPVSANGLSLAVFPSQLIVWPNSSWVSGYTGRAYRHSDAQLFTFLSDGTPSQSLTVYPNRENGWFSQDTLSKILPDQKVTLVTLAGETFTVTVPDFSLKLHLDTNTFSGLAPAGSQVFFEFQRGTEVYNFQTLSGPDGSYQLALDPALAFKPLDIINAFIQLPDGNLAQTSVQVPYLIVDTDTSVLNGFFTDNAIYSATLKDQAGAVKASFAGAKVYLGQVTAPFRDQFWSIVPVKPGDQVIFESAGITPITLVVSAAEAAADLGTDTISGTILPNSDGRLAICPPTSPTSSACGSQSFPFHAGPAGTFSLSTAPQVHLQSGDQVKLFQILPDGNEVSFSFLVGHLVLITEGSGNVAVRSQPGAHILVKQLNSANQLIETATGISDSSGWVNLNLTVQIGETLLITNSGSGTTPNFASQMMLADIGLDTFARPTGQITGHGPVSATLTLTLGGNCFDQSLVQTDAQGKFIYQAPFGCQPLPGNDYSLSLFAQPVQQLSQGFLPVLTVGYPNYISGRAFSNRPVTIRVKSNSGVLLDLGLVQANQQGFFFYSPKAWLMPGNLLEVTTGLDSLLMTLPVLDVQYDLNTHQISGHATPSSTVSLSTESAFLQVGSTGIFSYTPAVPLPHFTELSAAWKAPDGDLVETKITVAGLSVSLDTGRVEGYLRKPGPSAYLSLGNPTIAKANIYLPVTQGNYFKTNQTCRDQLPVQPVQFEAGDLLAAGNALDNASSITMTIPTLQATLDPITNKITGFAPAGSHLYIPVFSYDNSWDPWYLSPSHFVDVGPSGQFTLDFNGTGGRLQHGDYAYINYTSANGDRVNQAFSDIPRSAISLTITNHSAPWPNTPIWFEWAVTGGVGGTNGTYLVWDTVSHACDHDYQYQKGLPPSTATHYKAFIQAPASGIIYVAPRAWVNGYDVYGPEIAIPINPISPVIVDPVNGTTNQSRPVLHGFAPPLQNLEIYEQQAGGDILLGETAAALDGTFVYTLTQELPNGPHSIYGLVDGIKTNLLTLNIDTSLLVDPNHILFYNGTKDYSYSPQGTPIFYHMRDDHGYANLGGRVFFRAGNPNANISVPISCTTVTTVTLTIGGVFNYPLIEENSGIFSGDYQIRRNYAVVIEFSCNNIPHHYLIANGLIDPDGFVTDQSTGKLLEGAEVVCYMLDPQQGQFIPWDAYTWDQINPQVTDTSGYYSFIVPPGTYRIHASRPGYLDFDSGDLVVVDAPVHQNVPLLKIRKIFLPMLKR